MQGEKRREGEAWRLGQTFSGLGETGWYRKGAGRQEHEKSVNIDKPTRSGVPLTVSLSGPISPYLTSSACFACLILTVFVRMALIIYCIADLSQYVWTKPPSAIISLGFHFAFGRSTHKNY